MFFYVASSLSALPVPGNEFSYGAGLINLERALHPGLVYEECAENFYKYVKGELDIFGLNLPTFAASFPHSLIWTQTFERELMNIDEGDATYKFEVKYFCKDEYVKYVKIEADPQILKFKSKEKKKFKLNVEIRPRPWTCVSALIKWVPTDCDRCYVTSPIVLYHQSGLDRELVYKTAKEKRKGETKKNKTKQEEKMFVS